MPGWTLPDSIFWDGSSCLVSAGNRFAEPLFQSLPVYVLLPVGTVAALAWLGRRHRRAALLLAAALAAQAIGWAVVWGPRTAGQWVRVPSATAATLASVQTRIPASAEVIASQGVVGRFSGRTAVHELVGPGTTPIDRAEVWFVVTPSAGTELQSTASAMALIGQLAGPVGATLVVHRNGVWAFRWHPPAGLRTVRIPDGSGWLPGWTAPGTGHAVVTGPVASWHAAAGPGPGYAAYGLAWQEPPGRYRATVRLAAAHPVSVEVWNATATCCSRGSTFPPPMASRPSPCRSWPPSPIRPRCTRDGARSGPTSCRRRPGSAWRSGSGHQEAGRSASTGPA
ncbi:MAG: hypothetical protein ABJB47_08645 [Actinomycetota bacterium]